MDLLTITHKDFVLSIECANWEGIWYKAKGNVKEENLKTKYSWSEDVVSAYMLAGETPSILTNGCEANAVFFDNTDYPIWVDFNDDIADASFGTELLSVQENFSFHKQRHVLSGFLNYGNDIGRSEIILNYEKNNGERHQFTLGYEVLSTKLNYHEHWKKIVEDIESEYRMLSVDYLRRTFHSFKTDSDAKTNELIWWSLFQQEQKKFLKAIKDIIDRPRHKLNGNEIYLRADKLKRLTAQQEQQLVEHRKEPAYLYRAEEQIHSKDTMENRFLKYALNHIAKKYDTLKRAIEFQPNVTKELRDEMDETKLRLTRLKHHPFFRGIGPFKGLTQESQILQKATGYSQVYRSWCILRKGYSLNDGIYRLQTKDIATLYEIWCFIEVSHIVKELLHLDDKEVEQNNRLEMGGLFTWELGKGEKSCIRFKKNGIQLAELVYNPKHTQEDDESLSIENIVVKTVPQKPDIVLQLTKDDVKKGMKMTYLFDAKYRISSKDNGVDTPPDDAINQMHRYRDAIYYQDHESDELKKEVVGGYILFPGYAKTKEDVEKTGFYKSIAEVNIGAFPLRPNDEENRALLVDFINDLIKMPSAEILEDVRPQKGVVVEIPNRVLIGLVTGKKVQEVENETLQLYYTGRHFPTTIPLHDLHYFAPYIKGKGIKDVYEVTKVRTITGKEIKDDGDSTDIRLAFHLQNPKPLYDEYRMVSPDIDYTFKDTTFEELRKVIDRI